MSDSSEPLCASVPEALVTQRADRAIAQLFPAYSRSCLQAWMKAGRVWADGVPVQVRDKLRAGQSIEILPVAEPQTTAKAQAMPLTLVHEDAALLVVDKPAGLVVHPAAGNPDGTLQNALLHHFPELAEVPRSGIVHRLDKDTSGLLVVARTLAAHTQLVAQLQARQVKREYLALVQGQVVAGGTIAAPIGRHPVDRKRMAVVANGREALTHYRVRERFAAHTLLGVQLATGRTHQIRVHLAHQRLPLVGDPVYGGRLRLPAGAPPTVLEPLQQFRRQALHAARLGLSHPDSGEMMTWQAVLPADFQALLTALRAQQEALA